MNTNGRNGPLDTGVYAVVAEFKEQDAVLMETEGRGSSFEAAQARMRSLAARPDVLRVCVVRVEHVGVWSGNRSLLKSMENAQEGTPE